MVSRSDCRDVFKYNMYLLFPLVLPGVLLQIIFLSSFILSFFKIIQLFNSTHRKCRQTGRDSVPYEGSCTPIGSSFDSFKQIASKCFCFFPQMAENNISRAIEHVEHVLQQLRSGHPGVLPSVPSTSPLVFNRLNAISTNSTPGSTGIQTNSHVPYDALRGHRPTNPRTSFNFIPSSAESVLRSSMPPPRGRSTVGQSRYRGRIGNSHGNVRPAFQLKVVYLGHPQENNFPSAQRIATLASQNLGESVLETFVDASAEEVRQGIQDLAMHMEENEPQKKCTAVSWKLLYAKGSGKNTPLLPIRPEACASIPFIKRLTDTKKVFVKPNTMLCPFDDDFDDSCEEEKAGLSQSGAITDLNGSNTSVGDHILIHENQDSNNTANVDTPNGGFMFELPLNLSSSEETSVVEFETDTSYMGMLTLDDYRQHMMVMNPGINQLNLDRTKCKILNLETILDYYTRDRNLHQRLSVNFVNEDGIDCGGLTSEYFWQSHVSLYSSTYKSRNVFVGREGFLLPSSDVLLSRHGVYFKLGRFMNHCCFQIGFFFIGLSKVVSQYIALENVEDAYDLLDIEDDDLPCTTSTALLNQLYKFQGDQSSLSSQEKQLLQLGLEQSGVTYPLYGTPTEELIKLVKFCVVVVPRAAQLQALREGVRHSGIIHFLKYRGLYSGCFKTLEEAPLTVESIMAAFKHSDDVDVQDALQKLRAYLHWRVERGKPLKDFLIWLTGLPVLLSCDCLTLFVTAQGRYVEVDVCEKWLKMAKCVSHEALIEQFETALKDPAFRKI